MCAQLFSGRLASPKERVLGWMGWMNLSVAYSAKGMGELRTRMFIVGEDDALMKDCRGAR